MLTTPFVQLNDGNCMPALGLGTCAVRFLFSKSFFLILKVYLLIFNIFFIRLQSNGIEIEKAIKDAIDVGYRHIDTAWAYENENSIGKAIHSKIAEGVIERSDMFIVTKVSNHLIFKKLFASFQLCVHLL